MHVRISVDLKSSIHLCLIIVSIGSFLRWHFLNSLLQRSIISLKIYHILRKQLGVDGIAREWIIRVLLGTIFLFFKKDGLSIGLCARVAIENEALIFASSCVKLHSHDLMEYLIRETNFNLRSINFRVLLLVSSLFILCNCDVF
jgi:hypothetical protein